MCSSHKAIATISKGVVEEIQLPTPKPQDEQVLIKVAYSSVIAFDTYISDYAYFVSQFPLPLGLNAAGTVVQVGPKVDNLKVGDRVTTFARADEAKGKAMQEYALLAKYSVSKIPDALSLPEAATIPDNFVTAYFALFDSLRLPIPKSLPATSPPEEQNTPILIYGSGTTAGQYLIQILRLAGYSRILTTASLKHHEYLRSLGATDVFDYSNKDLSEQIFSVTNGQKIKYVVDCVSAESTLRQVAQVVGKGSIVSLLLPIKEGSSVAPTAEQKMWTEVPADRNPFVDGVELVGTKTFTYQQNTFMKENLLPNILPQLLANNEIQPNRVRLIENGTFKERAKEALELLRKNTVHGEKVVIKVA